MEHNELIANLFSSDVSTMWFTILMLLVQLPDSNKRMVVIKKSTWNYNLVLLPINKY